MLPSGCLYHLEVRFRNTPTSSFTISGLPSWFRSPTDMYVPPAKTLHGLAEMAVALPREHSDFFRKLFADRQVDPSIVIEVTECEEAWRPRLDAWSEPESAAPSPHRDGHSITGEVGYPRSGIRSRLTSVTASATGPSAARFSPDEKVPSPCPSRIPTVPSP
jgi:hypothetical protein